MFCFLRELPEVCSSSIRIVHRLLIVILEPKCICHGAVGTLIQHKKEHMIHCDIGPGSVFFQFTTVTCQLIISSKREDCDPANMGLGMMWHWLVSGLASGATIVLYDGSPFRPLVGEGGNLAMAKLVDELGHV